MFRCVKANESNDVIAIGWDEGQGGHDYHGIGVWQHFTFTVIPQPTPEVIAHAQTLGGQGGISPCLLKVEGGQVVAKTLSDLPAQAPSPEGGSA